MRKLITFSLSGLALTAALLVSAQAQNGAVFPSAGVSYPLLAPAGALGSPSYSFSALPAQGMYSSSSGVFIGANANYSWLFNTSGIIFGQFNGANRGSITLSGALVMMLA